MSPRAPLVGFRATEEDKAILSKLQEKLGISTADVIRIAIRKLAEEGSRKR